MRSFFCKTYYNCIFSSLLLLLTVGCATPSSDLFESITKQKEASVPGLADNPAPRLKSNVLPWDDSPLKGFQPGEKILTQKQLDAELIRMRAKYEPFMKDLAPAIKRREQLELDQFDWRVAEESEWENPAQALKGEGQWSSVAVPHYEGPIGKAFSFYRKEINLNSQLLSKKHLFIHFQGVDYYTHLYINDQYIGFHEGLFDSFEFDIRPFVQEGKNTLLVQVGNEGCPIGTTPIYGGTNSNVGPKMAASGGPGWDDPYNGWICTPVGFGLWQRVWIESRDETFINDVFVRPLIDQNKAEVWVELGSQSVINTETLEISYSLFGQNFSEIIRVDQLIDEDLEEGLVSLFSSPQPENAVAKPLSIRQLKFSVPIDNARLWSPDQPWLYQIQIQIKRDGKMLDASKKQFGMRSFVQSSDSIPKGRFYLNGDQIRLRGANMMGNIMQCIIRKDFDQLRDDILLAKISNMNFWRMTQQPCQEEAYDYFDKLGLMAQSDLPTFAYLPRTQGNETVREAGALHRLVRSHPSNIVMSYINEPMEKEDWAIPSLSMKETQAVFEKCDDLVSEVNPDQVIKWVDGDYANISKGYSDHHCYNLWYWKHAVPFSKQYKGEWVKTREGWMHGCGEYGVEGVDSPELMRKYYPEEWLGENSSGDWSSKKIPCQANRDSFKRWVGEPKNLDEFCTVSREHQRCSTRLQVEAFRRDPKMNSTAIHLLIDAWPAGWMKTIMDYDRKAKPAYFEFRDAQSPLAVNLRPDAFYAFSGRKMKVGSWICNDTINIPENAVLKYQLELNNKVIQTGQNTASVVSCEPEFQGWLKFSAPEVDRRTIMILRVGLFDGVGNLIHDSSVELEIIPADLRFKKLELPGGKWQFLIES